MPSIIYGLLALGLFVYQFGLGQSILTAGLTLALLILPIVIVATREAIRSIPQAIREGAYALRRDEVADGAATTSCRTRIGRHPHRRDHRHVARHRRDGADHHHRRADLHRVPAAGAGHRRSRRSCPFDWLIVAVHGDADPDVQLDLAPGSRPSTQNAAAAGLVLVLMTLAMNGLAIWLRYRLRKNIKW